MFRKMRRKDRAVSNEVAIKILDEAEYGILSTIGDDGYPYGVPIHHVYADGKIYFHCAVKGYKLDNIINNDKVTFCTVGKTEVLPSEFATDLESVIVFGRASIIEGEEKEEALQYIIKKFAKDFFQEGLDYIAKDKNITKLVKIDIENITGKVRLTKE